jgi:hypothetical protein
MAGGHRCRGMRRFEFARSLPGTAFGGHRGNHAAGSCERGYQRRATENCRHIMQCQKLSGIKIFMPAAVTAAPRVTITSNFLERGLVAFAATVHRGAAVEVRRCYCVVTKSEFAVPLSEQLQTQVFHIALGGHRHLVSQSRG